MKHLFNMLAGVSVSLCICCLVLLLFTYWDWHNASQQSVLYHLGYQRVPTGKFLVLITFAGLFAIAPVALVIVRLRSRRQPRGFAVLPAHEKAADVTPAV